MAEGSVGKLEEQALKRKEKLLALKRKREGKTEDAEGENQGDDKVELPKPKFRSYKPADDGLNDHLLPSVKPGDVAFEVKDQLESAKSEIVIDTLDVTTLAPRKPDWDLKRDVAKKLEKLERQTQKAIAELIRDRLKQGNENLADLVNAGAATTTNEP